MRTEGSLFMWLIWPAKRQPALPASLPQRSRFKEILDGDWKVTAKQGIASKDLPGQKNWLGWIPQVAVASGVPSKITLDSGLQGNPADSAELFQRLHTFSLITSDIPVNPYIQEEKYILLFPYTLFHPQQCMPWCSDAYELALLAIKPILGAYWHITLEFITQYIA